MYPGCWVQVFLRDAQRNASAFLPCLWDEHVGTSLEDLGSLQGYQIGISRSDSYSV